MSSTAVWNSSDRTLDELEDLRLDRHVERGRRLIGEDQLRIARQRDRDHHALAHAARELVRVVIEAVLRPWDADLAEQLDHAILGGLAGDAHVLLDRLADLVADRQGRVQARERVLEDEPDLLAAQLAHVVFAQAQHVDAVEDDIAGHDPPRRVGDEPGDR